jgi:hypothetical protein
VKTRLALLLLFATVFCAGGPAFGQQLYPVRGPLAAQPTPPVLKAKTKEGMVSYTLVAWILPNGELLNLDKKSYRWTVAFANNKTPGAPESYPPQPNLAFAWDAVYGQGYYVANVLGSKNVGQGLFSGANGTVLQIEFLRYPPGHAGGIPAGVAVDNQGNLYKMAW